MFSGIFFLVIRKVLEEFYGSESYLSESMPVTGVGEEGSMHNSCFGCFFLNPFTRLFF